MDSKQEICFNCERDKFCIDCKHKDVIIPTEEVGRLDITTFHRLSGTRPLSGYESTQVANTAD